MGTVRLKCAGAETLFYEPDGLLLSSSLVPVDDLHSLHVLTFQLSYLGSGNLVVYVAVEGPQEESLGGVDRRFIAAKLRDTAGQPGPGVWLTSMLLPDTDVHCRYTVWGQPGVEDQLRGELVAEVSGLVPLLTATVRVSVTQDPVPENLGLVPAFGPR